MDTLLQGIEDDKRALWTPWRNAKMTGECWDEVADKLIIIILAVCKALGELIVQDKCMHA